MKKQFLLYAISLLVSGPGATAAVEYEGYTNPAGNKFPIAVYDNVSINATKNGQPLTEDEQKDYFKDIKGAFFNVVLWGKGNCNDSKTKNKWVPYLNSLGMNTIISSRGYSLTRSKTRYDANTPDSILLHDNWEGLKRVITNYSQDPNVWGYWVSDEPGKPNLHKPVFEMEPYQVAVLPTFNRVHKFRGEKVAFANFAAVAAPTILGDFYTDDPEHPNPDIYIPNFEDFLDYMVNELGLKFLTFDLYPVIHNESEYGIGSGWVIKPFYYNMMDLYGRYCRDRKIPVWLTMLSVEHANYKLNGELIWEYPEITDGLLRLQAMNGLAFGMKGLLYWQYGSQGEKSGTTVYRSALYDINKMETTPAWNATRYVNCDVEQYGKYLLNATYDRGCLALNDSIKYTTSSFDSFPQFTDTFECIKKLTFEENDNEARFLLTHLTGEDGDYVAVVNQDHINRHKIKLTFYPENKVKYIKLLYMPANSIGDIIKGETEPIDLESLGVNLNLAPGSMALFKYQK